MRTGTPAPSVLPAPAEVTDLIGSARSIDPALAAYSHKVRLAWKAVPGADGYNVRIGPNRFLGSWLPVPVDPSDSSRPAAFEHILLPEPVHFGTSVEFAIPPSIPPGTPLIFQVQAVRVEVPSPDEPAGSRAKLTYGPWSAKSKAFWTVSDVQELAALSASLEEVKAAVVDKEAACAALRNELAVLQARLAALEAAHAGPATGSGAVAALGAHFSALGAHVGALFSVTAVASTVTEAPKSEAEEATVARSSSSSAST